MEFSTAMFYLLVIVLAVMLAYLVMSGRVSGYVGGRERPPSDAPPRLHLQDPWFSKVKDGSKTVEGRVGSDGQYNKFLGKQITIMGPEGKTVDVTVKAVRHHPDLKTFLKKESYKTHTPHAASAEEAAKLHETLTSGPNQTKVFDAGRIAERGGIEVLEFSL